MGTDVAFYVTTFGSLASGIELFVYLATDDPRWLSAALVTLAAAGIAVLLRRLGAKDNVDGEQDDLYWTDAMKAAEIEIADLSFAEMAERFEALDDIKSARTLGYWAHRRERLCGGMSTAERMAWARIATDLEPSDHDDDLPRCTCGVMRGVITPSRSCSFHGERS